MIELNEKNFKQVLKGRFAVEFYNSFSGPCIEFGPVFEAAEKKHGRKMKFARLDVEKYPKVAVKYIDLEIGVPTTIFFNKGDEFDRILGSCSEYALNAKIGDFLVIK